MSGFLAGKVWQSDLAPHVKPLAAALADIANDDGTSIYPSVEYVAWLLGRSERSVQAGLGELKQIGVLEVVAYRSGGRGHATEYRLIEGKLPRRTPWRQYRMKKGAASAPFPETTNGEVRATKGEVSEPERAQLATAKGEGGCTLPAKEPSSTRPSHTTPPPNSAVCGEIAAKASEGKPTEQECKDLFEQFWNLYPKPYSKHRTWAQWRSLRPTPEMLEAIIEDFTTRQRFPDWTRENGRFIPLSENYLKSRVWLDWDHPRAVPPPAIKRYLATLRAVPQGGAATISAG